MVALSTTEAEYVACSEAAREAQWLAKLHKDVVGNLGYPLPVYTDSNGALKNIQAAGYGKSRNKHIDIKLHHCRDLHATRELDFFLRIHQRQLSRHHDESAGTRETPILRARHSATALARPLSVYSRSLYSRSICLLALSLLALCLSTRALFTRALSVYSR
jgi:hypothetical protein